MTISLSKAMTMELKIREHLYLHLQNSQFRGLIVFDSTFDFHNWHYVVKDYFYGSGGQYNDYGRWKFPWGAELRIRIMAKEEDVKDLAGSEFSNIYTSQSIKRFEEKLLIYKRIKLDQA
jgi:hypothetical protein